MSDSSTDESNKEYFDLIRRLLVENYCILSSSVLLWYDHIISFDQEVHRIWRRKLTGASVLFFITRYSASIERITLVASLFLVTTDNSVCVPVLRLDDPLNDISIFIVGAFAALRLYAIFGRDWRLLVPMLLIAIGRVVISIFLQVNYTPIAFGPPLWGCGAAFNVSPDTYFQSVSSASMNVTLLILMANDLVNTATAALSLASDTLLLILTWVKTWEIKRASNGFGVNTPISTLLLRDGTLFFVLICAIQVFAIVSIQIGSDFPLFAVWTYWNQSFTVIFLSRFILNLRGVYASDRGSPSEVATERASDLHFASQVVGNLGAPLEVRPLFGASLSDRSEGSDGGSNANLHTATGTVVGPRSIGGSATLADTDVEERAGDGDHGAEHDRDHSKDYEVVEVCRDPLSAGLGWHPVDNLNVVEMETYNSEHRGAHAV